MATKTKETLGERVRRYRDERSWTLTELAEKAGVSKGYLSDIERGVDVRLSGDKLYDIASALGVTMSDLLGRELISEPKWKVSKSLESFALSHRLPKSDINMLASINFRGEPPKSEERWALIYSAIRSSEWMDKEK